MRNWHSTTVNAASLKSHAIWEVHDDCRSHGVGQKKSLGDDGKRLAQEVGSAIVKRGFHLLTGGRWWVDGGCWASISAKKARTFES
jgi:hypothetical protein